MIEDVEEEVWLRQKGESKEGYEAFEVYLNLGLERTNRATAKRVGKSIQLMNKWSSKNGWVKRARAWDNHNTRIFQESYDNATIEIAKRQAKMGKTLQDVGLKHIESLESKSSSMTYNSAVTTIKTGVDIERVAMGQATQVVSGDVKVGTRDVADMSTADLLKRVQKLLESEPEEDTSDDLDDE